MCLIFSSDYYTEFSLLGCEIVPLLAPALLASDSVSLLSLLLIIHRSLKEVSLSNCVYTFLFVNSGLIKMLFPIISYYA